MRAQKRCTAGQIVSKLREAEAHHSQGLTVMQATSRSVSQTKHVTSAAASTVVTVPMVYTTCRVNLTPVCKRGRVAWSRAEGGPAAIATCGRGRRSQSRPSLRSARLWNKG